jgi:class 3 adenylate cyclase/tetratricopeptide (TPR) repeat protein
MACQSCGAVNRDAARFCATCGAPLIHRCAACDAELAPTARFCDQCGASVDRTDEAKPHDVGQIRKVVTIVFADLAGSTALAEQMDPESVRVVMDRYYAILRDAVERFDGRLVKFTGDGMMAVFGIPDTAEDDVRRALQSSLALHTGFAALASQMRDERDVDIGLRVGVNTGEVVVSSDDDDVVGDVVNVAARLEQAAPHGAVLAGDSTWRAGRGDAAFGDIELIDAAGKSEPVVARRLLHMRVETSEPSIAFVGRDADMRVLTSAFDDVVAESAARLVTVVGSPGVGKSRLAAEFSSGLAERAIVLTGECVAEGTSALEPIADVVRAAAGLPDTADAAEVVEALRAVIRYEEADRDRVVTAAAGLLGAMDASTPEETFWSIRRLLEALARARPMLVVLDDVHWAEPMLLDLIEHLAEWTRAPLMLLAVARPELREVRGSLVDRARHPVIALEGLDTASTRELVRAFLGTDDVPEGLAQLVPESTGGNPLFVRELVRTLVDDQVLRSADEGWELAVSAADIEVPPTVQALLAARLDRLPADEQLILERASITGNEFPLGALLELVPSSKSTTAQVLDRLRKKELVEPDGTYWIDEPVWRFHHVLIRDAAYRRLLRQHRAELHERLARWLTTKSGSLRGEHEELVGFHLEQAYRQYRELGPLDARARDVGRDAAARLARAAESALAREDLPGASALSARALDCLPVGDPARAHVLLTRCEALLVLAEAEAAREAIDELRALVGADARMSAWCECFDAHLATMIDGGRLRTIERHASDVAQRFAQLGDTRGVAKAHTVRAATLARLGQYGDAEIALDTALTAARESGDRRLATVALAAAPVAALFGPSPVPRAGGRCLDVVRLVRITAGSPAVEATSQRCQALLEAFRGRDDAARRMVNSARAMLEELGVRHAVLETELFAGMVELVIGDLERARRHLEFSLDGLRALGAYGDTARAAALLARACFEDGDIDAAEAHADDARRLAGDELQSSIAWRGVAAQVCAARGRREKAIALAEEAVTLASATDALVHHAESRFMLARVHLALGDRAEAEHAAREAAELYERKAATRLADRARALAGIDDGGDGAGRDDGVRVADEPRTLPHNACLDLVHAWQALYLAQDWDGMRDMFTHDFEHEDRRPVLRARSDRSKSASALRVLSDQGRNEFVRGVVALRGERLALTHSIDSTNEDMFRSEALTLWELGTDGRLAAVVTFRPEDRGDAIAEIDRRHLAGEGAPYQRILSLTTALVDSYNTRDWEAFRAACSPTILTMDHRPAVWGTLVGADALVDVLRLLIEMVPDAYLTVTVMHAISVEAILCSGVLSGQDMSGAQTEFTFHLIFREDRAHLGTLEIFPLDALDDAIAAYRGRSGSIRNACTDAIDRLLRAFSEHDWSAMRALFAPDYDNERPPLVGEESLDPVASLRVAAEQGEGMATYTPLAIRGDRLALGRWGAADPDAFVTPVVSVHEIDSEGLFSHTVLRDVADLDDAFRVFEEWYLAGEAAPYAAAYRSCVRFSELHNARDWDGLLALWSKDLVVVDHRPGGFGTMTDRHAYLGLVQQFVEIAPDAKTRGVSILALRSHGCVALVRNGGTSADGSDVELWFLLVLVVGAGCITEIEHFPPDAVDDAIARLDALGPNAAAARFQRLHDFYLRRDWGAYEAVLTDQVVYEDRRSVMRNTVRGRDSYIAVMRGLAESGVVELDESLLATRGDQLALYRTTTHGRHAYSFEVSILGVYEWDDKGCLLSLTMFDGDDLASALQELDDRYEPTIT